MRIFISVVSLYVVLAIAIIGGWVMNIHTLLTKTFPVIDAEFILRIVGIPVAFLGAILGYLG